MRNFLSLLLFVVISTGCSGNHNKNVSELDQLLSAIDHEDISAIQNIVQSNDTLLNYVDSDYLNTPLIRAIYHRKLKSVKSLLSLGANPNIRNNQGVTPQIVAIIDSRNHLSRDDTKFLSELLNAGANPNDTCYWNGEKFSMLSPQSSMLMLALNYSQDKAQLLIDYGADINYMNSNNISAAIESLINNQLDIAEFIIVERHADITKPFYFQDLTNDSVIDYSDPHYAVELLLDMTYDLKSKEFQKKSTIIDEFIKQGINYQSYKDSLDNRILYRIKKLYPNDWKEYLELY